MSTTTRVAIAVGIVILLLGLGFAWYVSSQIILVPVTGDGTPTQIPEAAATPASKDDLITVDTPLPNGSVSSPLTVKGKARGGWYFEASFPVQLYDGNGKLLASAPAQAQGEWMTTEYVPFSVTLTYEKPTTATGKLVLKKDNPSGLPENENQLEIPVQFGVSAQTTTVKLYYYNPALDNSQCTSKGLVAVNRTIPKTSAPLTATINLLLTDKLTDAEKAQGLTTEFPLEGVSLTKASVHNGLASLTFADVKHKLSGGACRIAVMRAQIEAISKQFTTVSAVKISPDSVLQP